MIWNNTVLAKNIVIGTSVCRDYGSRTTTIEVVAPIIAATLLLLLGRHGLEQHCIGQLYGDWYQCASGLRQQDNHH